MRDKDTQPNTQSYDFYVGDNLVNNQGLSYHFELIGVDSSGNLIGGEYFDSGSFIVAAAGSGAFTTTTTAVQAVTITATEQVTTTVTPFTTTLTPAPTPSASPTTVTLISSTSSPGVVVITVTGSTPASTSVAVQTTNGASSGRLDLANVVCGLLVGCIGFLLA